MATFRKRGKRWQAIIRKSGQKPVVKTFPNKAQAETWARASKPIWIAGMGRPYPADKKTVDDVIATMHTQQDTGKGQQTTKSRIVSASGQQLIRYEG